MSKTITLEPCYTQNCTACGRTPCVVGVYKDGKEEKFELCGACLFGEAGMLAAENWEGMVMERKK